jgi:hypothetical protein
MVTKLSSWKLNSKCARLQQKSIANKKCRQIKRHLDPSCDDDVLQASKEVKYRFNLCERNESFESNNKKRMQIFVAFYYVSYSWLIMHAPRQSRIVIWIWIMNMNKNKLFQTESFSFFSKYFSKKFYFILLLLLFVSLCTHILSVQIMLLRKLRDNLVLDNSFFFMSINMK